MGVYLVWKLDRKDGDPEDGSDAAKGKALTEKVLQGDKLQWEYDHFVSRITRAVSPVVLPTMCCGRAHMDILLA